MHIYSNLLDIYIIDIVLKDFMRVGLAGGECYCLGKSFVKAWLKLCKGTILSAYKLTVH